MPIRTHNHLRRIEVKPVCRKSEQTGGACAGRAIGEKSSPQLWRNVDVRRLASRSLAKFYWDETRCGELNSVGV